MVVRGAVVVVHSPTLFAFMLDGQEFRIAPDDVLPGTTATWSGDQGSVVIRRWLGCVLGLLPESTTPPSGSF